MAVQLRLWMFTAVSLAALGRSGGTDLIDPEIMKKLGLPEPQQVHIPVHVNLLFIGFDKKFPHSPDVTFKDLKQWLESGGAHDPMKGRHVRMRSSLYSSSSLLRGVQVDMSPDISYEFRVQLVEMSPLVHAALEAALKTFMRLETVSADSLYQVDPDKMATLFESLLHTLNLSDYYNVLLLNPDVASIIPGRRYGYRTGFSAAEIHKLFTEQMVTKAVQGPLREDEAIEDFPEDHDPEHEAEPISKNTARAWESVRQRQIRDLSEKWASNFLLLNRDVIKTREALLKKGTPREQCGRSETIVLKDENDVSDHGDGHGHGHRINMQYNISAVQMAYHIKQSGSDSAKHYLDMVLEKGPEFVRQTCLVDVWSSRGRYAWIDLAAGPFTWGPQDFPSQLVRTEYRLPRPQIHLFSEAKKADLVSHLQETCKHKKGGYGSEEVRLCEGVHSLKVDPFLAKVGLDQHHVHGQGAREKTLSSLDILRLHTRATVHDALRHLLAGPVALFRNISQHYSSTEHVKFKVFVTADHNSFRPTDAAQGGLDLITYRREMTKFKLPSQSFDFKILHSSKDQEKSLWVSLHRCVKDVQQVDGISYGRVDANQLAEEVNEWLVAKQEVDNYDNVKQVSVVVFSVARSVPLLFDGASQAVATPHGILVLQSSHTKWPTGFSCNGLPTFGNLRDPLRAMLLTSATFLTGITAHHHAIPQSGDSLLEEDWLWSVGDSPLSATSDKAHFSALQRDMAHRHTIALRTQAVMDNIHHGLDLLATVLPQQPVRMLKAGSSWNEIKGLYRRTFKQLRHAMAQVSNLDFYRAIKTLDEAERTSGEFHAMMMMIVFTGNVLSDGRLPAWFTPLFIIVLAAAAIGFWLWWKHVTRPGYSYRLPVYKNK